MHRSRELKKWPHLLLVLSAALAFLSACGSGVKQISEDQLNFQKKMQENKLLQGTVYKPGSTEPYDKGRSGGTWLNNLNDDLKTFNPVVAVYDAESAGIVSNLASSLLE